MTKKVKKIRLRVVCDLCRPFKKKTDKCQHQSCYYFPETMKVSDLPSHLGLEINPIRK